MIGRVVEVRRAIRLRYRYGEAGTGSVKNNLSNPAPFMNPPLAQLGLVVASDNGLLNGAPPFRFSPEEVQKLYQNLFGGAPLPRALENEYWGIRSDG